ncbi:MAG: CHASE2 domain-containing protein [Saprospiraceae bacterium]
MHALIYSTASFLLLYFIHHLPVNQLFIDPFSEAIKGQDLMDVALSKFRNKKDAKLFEQRLLIINSGITDRTKIANTISYLNRHEAKVIGLDLLVDTFYKTPADTLLQTAIHNSNQIVFGYTFLEGNKRHSSSKLLESNSFFTQGKLEGYVNLGTNDRFSVRTFEPFHPIHEKIEKSFGLQIASYYDPLILADLEKRNLETEWINYRRVQPGKSSMIYPINRDGLQHYEMLSIDNFLQDTSLFPLTFFTNKIVLIGFCGENENALSMKDRYFTPLNEQYTGRSIPDMHGVIIHANIISMLLDRDFICEVSHTKVYIYTILLFIFNFFLYSELEHKNYFRSIPFIRIIQIIEFFIFLALCLVLLISFNIKLGFIFIITSIIMSYEFFEIYEAKLKLRVEKILGISV